jgi:hypothetical protein
MITGSYVVESDTRLQETAPVALQSQRKLEN